MAGGPVARPYAEALIQIGAEQGLLDTFRENLDALAEILAGDPEIRVFFESPRIDRAVKRRVIETAFGPTMHENVVSLLVMLVEKARQLALPEIIETFAELHDEKVGRVEVKLFTARPLDGAATSSMASRLTSILKKEILIHEEVDPSLLGGVVLHVGDTVVDGSLKRRLYALDRKMRFTGSINGDGIYEN